MSDAANVRLDNVDPPIIFIPTHKEMKSAGKSRIILDNIGSIWQLALNPKHVRSKLSSRDTRAGHVYAGLSASTHCVIELPYVIHLFCYSKQATTELDHRSIHLSMTRGVSGINRYLYAYFLTLKHEQQIRSP